MFPIRFKIRSEEVGEGQCLGAGDAEVCNLPKNVSRNQLPSGRRAKVLVPKAVGAVVLLTLRYLTGSREGSSSPAATSRLGGRWGCMLPGDPRTVALCI